MNRIRAFLYIAILCSSPIAVPARAATSNVDQRAVKFGATLPATCWTGDIFFNTNAIAGSNLYACVALNTWVLQGGASGGGASNAGQLTDFTDSRVSAVEIDTTLPAGGTRVRAGTVIRSITTSPEKMVGGGNWCAAGGQLWKYVDAVTGAVKVDANANVTLANITFTAITAGSNFASGFPADGSTPIASYTCGNNAANQWDTSPFADWRPFLGDDGFLAGPFTTVTPGARWTFGLDTSKVGNGANATMLVGAVSALSQSAGTPVCDDGSGGVKDTGCSGSGGSSTAVFPIVIPTCMFDTGDSALNYFQWEALGQSFTVRNTNGMPSNSPCYLGMAVTTGHGAIYDFTWLPGTTQIDIGYSYILESGSGTVVLAWSLGCHATGTSVTSSVTYGSDKLSSAYNLADDIVGADTTSSIPIPSGCAANLPAKLRLRFDSSGTRNGAGNFLWGPMTMMVTRTLP